GHKIAVVLHHRQQDHVSFTNEFSAPRLSDEINALGGSTREDDFLSTRGANEIRNALPRFFVSFRRARTQRVQPAMNICVVVFIKIPKRLEHYARLLRCCRAIEINQRMTVRLFAKNREIFAKRLPINRGRSGLVHATICYTRGQAPLYSTQLQLRKPAIASAFWPYASSWFTSPNALTANSRSSRECAADTCVRIRAVPCGTTG